MFLKKDRDEIKFVLNKLGRKRVNLNDRDKKFVKYYTENFISCNSECSDAYSIIYELYTLELRILYLVFLVDTLDFKSARVKKYRKEIADLQFNLTSYGFNFYSDMFSQDGYEISLDRNGKRYLFKIFANDFKNYIVGE